MPSQINTAASMGARRKDLFSAIQVTALFCGAVVSGLWFISRWIPYLFAWEGTSVSLFIALNGLYLFVYLLICVMLMLLGMVCAMVMMGHRDLGVILMVVTIMVIVTFPLLWVLGLIKGITQATMGWICVVPQFIYLIILIFPGCIKYWNFLDPLCGRVWDIARGAAIMTEMQLDIVLNNASSELVGNISLERIWIAP